MLSEDYIARIKDRWDAFSRELTGILKLERCSMVHRCPRTEAIRSANPASGSDAGDWFTALTQYKSPS